MACKAILPQNPLGLSQAFVVVLISHPRPSPTSPRTTEVAAIGRVLLLGQWNYLMRVKILSGKVRLGQEEGKRVSLLCDLELISKVAGRRKNINQTMRASESLPGNAKNDQKMDNVHFEI